MKLNSEKVTRIIVTHKDLQDFINKVYKIDNYKILQSTNFNVDSEYLVEVTDEMSDFDTESIINFRNGNMCVPIYPILQHLCKRTLIEEGTYLITTF